MNDFYLYLLGLVLILGGGSGYTFFLYYKLKKLKSLGLYEWSGKHNRSDYTPQKIVERLKNKQLKTLYILGNGCSKWSQYEIIESLTKTTQKDLKIIFLASCPIYLYNLSQNKSLLAFYENSGQKLSQEKLKEKAKQNAKSILELINEGERKCEHIKVMTYKSLATLRIIIIDDYECIVGHYKSGSQGDSQESPLFVFLNDKSNEWSFYGGIHRVFNSHKLNATVPTEREIALILEIKEGRKIDSDQITEFDNTLDEVNQNMKKLYQNYQKIYCDAHQIRSQVLNNEV